MSDEMVGTVKLGADGWPIRYCKDRHGNFGWVGMILPPWDRNGTYDFVIAGGRATVFAPGRVRTIGGLDSLPETVVIMDDNGAVARKYGSEWRWAGMEVSFLPSLPVTVLWSPEAA